MGLFDKLVGKKPVAPERLGRTAGEDQLLRNAEQLRRNSAVYRSAQNTYMAEVLDPTSQRRAAGNLASIGAAQRFRPSAQGVNDARDVRAMGSLIARARATARVSSAADTTATEASLRARVAMARYGRGIQSAAYGQTAGASSTQDALRRAKYSMELGYDREPSPVAGALGSVIGAGLRYWQERRLTDQPSAGSSLIRSGGGSMYSQYIPNSGYNA